MVGRRAARLQRIYRTGKCGRPLILAGLAELAKKAEGGCPISNAIRGNVEVTVKTSIAQKA